MKQIEFGNARDLMSTKRYDYGLWSSAANTLTIAMRTRHYIFMELFDSIVVRYRSSIDAD